MFNKNKKYNKGVTLLELMVVVSIILILTVVSIADYGQFKSSIALQNLSDDIALSIRKAQGLAIGVQKAGSSFENVYGINFEKGKKEFYIFAENKDSGNHIYDNSELIEMLTIKGANEVSEISPSDIEKVNIIFSRPNLEPSFYDKDGDELDTLSSIEIKIKNDNYDNTKTITIYKNGQISSS